MSTTTNTHHWAVDGHAFDQRTDAMAFCDLWGYHYGQIVWVDPDAPWA